jgi:ribonuclease BN (tRNA processing enzyme)
MVEVTFLGTNGWYSTRLANTSCVLIKSEQSYVILDAGDGIFKLDRYIEDKKPINIFLSHLHLDHIIGLHILSKFNFKQKIGIYGYSGTKEGLTIIRHPYTAPFNCLPMKVNVYDLQEGEQNLPFPFTCRLLVHSDPCLGYRLELDNKIITYCTDTGVCKNLHELSKNADLLILECSFKPGQIEWGWPHLKPEDAATVAEKADVKELVLTHFDASIYESFEDRKRAAATAKKIFRKTSVAFDDLEIEV